jgi:hypothetical protein
VRETKAINGIRNRALAWLASRRSFRRDRSARVSAEAIGYGLVVAGAVVAFITLLLAVFFSGGSGPFGAWSLEDSEIGAVLGILLVIGGVVAHAAD